jgi:hypothetical protein
VWVAQLVFAVMCIPLHLALPLLLPLLGSLRLRGGIEQLLAVALVLEDEFLFVAGVEVVELVSLDVPRMRRANPAMHGLLRLPADREVHGRFGHCRAASRGRLSTSTWSMGLSSQVSYVHCGRRRGSDSRVDGGSSVR